MAALGEDGYRSKIAIALFYGYSVAMNKRHLWVGMGIVALICIVYPIVVRYCFGSWEKSGEFGDSFGALSCFFSLLSFGGVVYALIIDRQFREIESERAYYKALLDSIDCQIITAKEREDESAIIDLSERRKYYAETFEDILTKDKSLPFLKDDDIVRLFCTIPWFTEGDIKKNVHELRNRLRPWKIFTKQDLEKLVLDSEIKKEIAKVYIDELKRDPNQPFDSHALATWGGLFYSQDVSEGSRKMFVNAIRQSPEWKQKNQGH